MWAAGDRDGQQGRVSEKPGPWHDCVEEKKPKKRGEEGNGGVVGRLKKEWRKTE